MALTQEQSEALLADYIDGALDEEHRRMVERSLAADPERARAVRQMSRGRALVAGLPREPAPADLAGGVLAQLEREELLAPAGWSIDGREPAKSRLPLAVAAGIGLLLVGGAAAVLTLGLPESTPVVAQADPPAESAPVVVTPADPDLAATGPSGTPDVRVETGVPTPEVAQATPAVSAEPTRPADDAEPVLLDHIEKDKTQPDPVLIVVTTRDVGGSLAELREALAARSVFVPLDAEYGPDGTLRQQVSLTRSQAVEVAAAMESEADGRHATLLGVGEPAGGEIEAGDAVRVEVLHPGEPGESAAVEADVARDGTLVLADPAALPFGLRMAGDGPVVGRTERELQEELAARLAAVDAEARVRVTRRPPEPPTTAAPGDTLVVTVAGRTQRAKVGDAGQVQLQDLPTIFVTGDRPEVIAEIVRFHREREFPGSDDAVSVRVEPAGPHSDADDRDLMPVTVVFRRPPALPQFIPAPPRFH